MSRITLIIWAIVFALYSTAAGFIALARWPEFPANFLGADDGDYLWQPYNSFQHRALCGWRYLESPQDWPILRVLTDRPNSVVDYLVGALTSILSLQPLELKLFLSVLISFLCFLILVRFFMNLASPVWSALAAFVTLRLPFLGLFESLAGLPEHWSSALVYTPIVGLVGFDYTSLRAVCTQVSFPLYLIVTCGIIQKLLISPSIPKTKDIFILGLLSGLLCQIYIFPWLTATAFGIFTIGYQGLTCRPGRSFRQTSKLLIIFLAAVGLASAPGCLILLGRDIQAPVSSPVLHSVWFFPVDRMLLSCAALVLSFAVRHHPLQCVLAAIGLLGIIELPLMSLQTILGAGLAIIHCTQYFLYPLISGLMVVLVPQVGQQYIRSLWNDSVARYVFGAIFLLLDISVRLNNFAPPALVKEVTELFQDINEHTAPDAVIAMSDVLLPFEPTTRYAHNMIPTYIPLLTGRYILSQSLMLPAVNDVDNLQRELGMGYLLSGRPQPLFPCPEQTHLPGDIFSYIVQWNELIRYQRCQRNQKILLSYSPCEFIRNYRVDYVVFYQQMKVPDSIQPFVKEVAQSSKGYYRLLELDWDRMQKRCEIPGAYEP